MIKLLFWGAVALAALGAYMGVIQFTFHWDKLGNISSITQGVSNWQDAVSKADYYGVTWKRKVELYFAGSDDARFSLDVGYVSSDADALGKALDAKSDAGVIIPKAQLLTESLTRAKSESDKVSKDAMAKVRDQAVKAYASAQTQLDRLHTLSDQYKQYQTQLDNLGKTETKIPLKF